MKRALLSVLAVGTALMVTACGGTTAQSAQPVEKETFTPIETKVDFESAEELQEFFYNAEWPAFVDAYLSDGVVCFNGNKTPTAVDVDVQFAADSVTIDGTTYKLGDTPVADPIGREGSSVTHGDFSAKGVRFYLSSDREEMLGNIDAWYGTETDFDQKVTWNGNMFIEINIEQLHDMDVDVIYPLSICSGSWKTEDKPVQQAPSPSTPSAAEIFDVVSLGSYKGQNLEWLVVAQSGSTKTLMCLQAVDWVDMGNTTGTYEDTNIYAFVNGGFLAGFDVAGAKVTSVTLASPEELAKVDAPVFETLLMLPEEDYSAGKKYWTTVFSYLVNPDDVNCGFGNNSIAFFDKYGGDGGGSKGDICGLVPLITVEY